MITLRLSVLLSALVAFIACGNISSDSNNDTAKPDQNFIDQSEQQEVSSSGKGMDDSYASGPDSSDKENSKTVSKGSSEPVQMDKEMFLERVFNYEENPETFKFKGNRPAIIDFYADWCAPCKRVAPIMDDLAGEYQGKVDIYKVDTEQEKELASVFRISSIPSVLFIPANGKPAMYSGAFPKSKYQELMHEHFEL
ncbi:MAG: thioredoxin domain-containing protein [Bacteroidales bacterium]